MADALIIVGAGGLGAEAAWTAEEINAGANAAGRSDVWNILGFVDDDLRKKGALVFGYPVLGRPEDLRPPRCGSDLFYICAVGKNQTRQTVAARIAQYGWRAATLIHPSVIRARDCRISEGTYIGPASVICPNAEIGSHVVVNVGVSVGHDSRIDDFAQLCPGARISGACHVGSHALIGSNAALMPRVRVGEGATVGACSQAVRTVKPYTTVAGVPACTVTSLHDSQEGRSIHAV